MSDSKALGIRTRRVNIDRTLADRLNAEVKEEERQRRIEEKKKAKEPKPKPQVNPFSLEGRIVGFDVEPANRGALATHDEWLKYWSTVKDGRTMMSAGDFYAVLKKAQECIFLGSKDTRETYERFINNLKEYCDANTLIFSTLLLNLKEPVIDDILINHFGHDSKPPFGGTLVDDPGFRYETLNMVLSSDKGLRYLQAYFDTTDDGSEIKKTMELISPKAKPFAGTEDTVDIPGIEYKMGMIITRTYIAYLGINNLGGRVIAGTGWQDKKGFSLGVQIK
jgi:hypothetical protein